MDNTISYIYKMPEFSRYRQPSSTESEVAQDLPDSSPKLPSLQKIQTPPTDCMKANVEAFEKRKVILFKNVTTPLPEPLDIFMDMYARTDPENIKIAEASPDTCHIQTVFHMIPLQYIDVVPSSVYKDGEDMLIDWGSAKDYFSEKIIDTILSEGQITAEHSYVKKYVALGDAQYVLEYLEAS